MEARTPDNALATGLDAPLHEVMRTMRAMRRLRPDTVPAAVLEQLVEAATWAPSASNAQAYSWVVVTEREPMERLAVLWAKCFELYMGTVGRVTAQAGDPGAWGRVVRAAEYQRDHFAETPALIVPCYDLASQRRGLQRQLPAIGRHLLRQQPRDVVCFIRGGSRASTMAEAASVYPGVQNLLLTARALGLGATMTTWHLMLEAQVKEALGIPKQVKTFALIPVGWPKGRFGPVRRRPAAEAIHWQRW